ncbi:invasion associated locus B family protein [Reyranella sp.]|uniref:invasion associated locus B family protein n=1 Tax=Reyranella sp. TaxID=1929291 RepID=UPI0025DE30B6|nr:invasion associated locus B family protein [Reyranella sp.]
MRRAAICALAALAFAAPALAQPQTPPAPTAPAKPAAAQPAPAPAADPAQTTATYADWVLRCVRTGDKNAGPRVCEVVQTMVLQGQQQPVAQVAVGYDKNELRMTLLLPPAVSFSRTPTLSVPGLTGPHFDLAWRRCLPNGCFADMPVGVELLKLLRSRGEPMQIAFKDAGERDGALPFSMRGLVPALDALAKEPR